MKGLAIYTVVLFGLLLLMMAFSSVSWGFRTGTVADRLLDALFLTLFLGPIFASGLLFLIRGRGVKGGTGLAAYTLVVTGYCVFKLLAFLKDILFSDTYNMLDFWPGLLSIPILVFAVLYLKRGQENSKVTSSIPSANMKDDEEEEIKGQPLILK